MRRAVMHRLRTWAYDDYATAAESAALAVVLEIALWTVPIATILKVLDGIPSRAPARDLRNRIERLDRFAMAACRLVFAEPTCLRRSLIVCALLRRRGVPARVCFGVDRRGASIAAHAWVAVGACSRDEGASRFLELRGAWHA